MDINMIRVGDRCDECYTHMISSTIAYINIILNVVVCENTGTNNICHHHKHQTTWTTSHRLCVGTNIYGPTKPGFPIISVSMTNVVNPSTVLGFITLTVGAPCPFCKNNINIKGIVNTNTVRQFLCDNALHTYNLTNGWITVPIFANPIGNYYNSRGIGPFVNDVTPKDDTITNRIKDYPHKCPRCGFDCYIGFNMVDHLDKNKNGICK